MAETISIVIVIVIDDNQAIREAIGSLLRSVGLQAKLLASADEFLKTGRQAGPAFLVLDVPAVRAKWPREPRQRLA